MRLNGEFHQATLISLMHLLKLTCVFISVSAHVIIASTGRARNYPIPRPISNPTIPIQNTNPIPNPSPNANPNNDINASSAARPKVTATSNPEAKNLTSTNIAGLPDVPESTNQSQMYESSQVTKNVIIGAATSFVVLAAIMGILIFREAKKDKAPATIHFPASNQVVPTAPVPIFGQPKRNSLAWSVKSAHLFETDPVNAKGNEVQPDFGDQSTESPNSASYDDPIVHPYSNGVSSNTPTSHPINTTETIETTPSNQHNDLSNR